MANKLYAQYRDKPKITAWSDIPKNLSDTCVTVSNKVSNSYDIDSNSGEALDVIGRIVVQDRGFIETITLDVYELNNVGDWEMGDFEVQMSSNSVATDSELSDEYYRYLLKSKIIRNNSEATIDDILTAMNTAIPTMDARRLVDGEDMTFSIEFYGVIDPVARDLLISGNLVPRPQGVLFNGFLEGIDLAECNADGDFEMGDESVELTGFIGAA